MTQYQAVENASIAGPAGAIQTLIDVPAAPPSVRPRGIALVCHPHPLFGGTAENKVVQTLAKTLRDLGYVALRPHFRGVGGSGGTHDDGQGETDDMLAVLDWARARFGDLPVVLAGFSFGAFVQASVAQRLAGQGRPAERLVLVGTAAGFVSGARHYETFAVAPDTLVIHGDKDETVPLDNVLAWAQPLNLKVHIVQGADHFFHRRLQDIRDIVVNAWKQ